VPQRVGRGIAILSMTAALEGDEWSAARPSRTLPPGKTRYPCYRRLGGLQDRSGQAKNLVPFRIRSRTVQPVAQSLYRLSYPAHPEVASRETNLTTYFAEISNLVQSLKGHAHARSHLNDLVTYIFHCGGGGGGLKHPPVH